jgi:lysophospholipase
MAYPYALPDLESRFLPNENWQDGFFDNPKTNHKIHYSSSLVSVSKGTVVILPGLSEFSEKYIETAQFFNAHHYDIYIIDWAYQGRSTRRADNPQKRHSDGYETDISDLTFLINNIIPTNKPLYMLAHSMGGHIGLRYLATQNHKVKAASFSAPMLGIKGVRYFPAGLSALFKPIENFYIPTGKDWHESSRKSDGTDIFTSDPIRDQVHNKWKLSNSELQVGYPTFKWIRESLNSILFMKQKENLQEIKIPTLIATAGKEALVDNKAIQSAAPIMLQTKLMHFKNAKHEILMEIDDIRDQFLNETLYLFKK